MQNPDNSTPTTLYTDWRYYRKALILSILLIPFWGFGLVPLLYFLVKIKLQRYRLSADGIEFRNTFLPFNTIKTVKVTDYRVLRSGNIGSILITSESITLVLKGIVNPSAIQVFIENRIQELKHDEFMRKQLESNPTTQAAGTVERLNELVGLWQQGLLTDEQFHEEKKKMVS